MDAQNGSFSTESSFYGDSDDDVIQLTPQHFYGHSDDDVIQLTPQHHFSSDAATRLISQPHSSNDAAAHLTSQLATKVKRKISTSQDPNFDPEGSQEKVKRKKTSTVKQVSSSKIGGGRIFTEKDEIAILQGLLGYNRTNSISDPSSVNWSKFHTHLTAEGKLSSGLTTNQIYEKVRRLKKKWMKNLEKEKNGDGIFLTSRHDIVLFKISKKVWGGVGSDIDASNGIRVDEAMVEEEKKEEQHGYDTDGEDPDLSKLSEHPFSMEEKLRYIGSEKGRELEMEWMKIRLMEIEHQITKLKMESELINIAMNEMKKV